MPKIFIIINKFWGKLKIFFDYMTHLLNEIKFLYFLMLHYYNYIIEILILSNKNYVHNFQILQAMLN